MNMKRASGFTLLEIIIVIIIVGVLASLALPRMFGTVEFSRSAEALQAFTAIRGSMERCFLMANNAFTSCDTFAELDMPNPGESANAHFTYTIYTHGAAASTLTYTIRATRMTRDGGVATHTIILTVDGASISKAGDGAFSAIK